MDERDHEDRVFLAGLASVMLGQRVGGVEMPLAGMDGEQWVYGGPECGFLYVDPGALAAAKRKITGAGPGVSGEP